MCLGISVNKNKIGNLLVLLSLKIRPLYHTKLLKLLYLIDEESVLETGVPVTWLDYQVWKLGPVPPKIYDLKFLNNDFPEYIDIIKETEGTRIEPLAEFNDEDFSEYELKLVNTIIDKYQFSNGSALVKITHKKNGLWDKAVKKHGISFDEAGISPFFIDLSDLIQSDNQKSIHYNLVKETLMFEKTLSDC